MNPDLENRVSESSYSTIEALLENGQWDSARKHLEMLNPEDRARPEYQELECHLLWSEQRLDELASLIGSARSHTSNPRERWFLEIYDARIAGLKGGLRTALERITEFLATYGDDLSLQQRAQGHAWLANAWFDLRCVSAARAEYSRSLRIHEMLGDLRGIAQSLNSLGRCERSDGHWDNAVAMFEHAIRLFEKAADPRGIGVACARLGILRLFRGHFGAGISSLQRAILLGHETGDSNVHMYRAAIGLLYVRTEAPHARSYLARLFWSNRRLRLARPQALTCEYLGELALSERRWKPALRWFHRAIEIAEPSGLRDVVGEATCRLAELDLAQERPAEALRRIDACLADFESMEDVYEIAVCRRVRGQALLALGRTDEAIQEFELALKFFDSVGEQFESLRVQYLASAAIQGKVVLDVRAEIRKATTQDREASSGTPVWDSANPSVPAPDSSEGTPTDESNQGNQTRIRRNHPDFPGILGTSSVLLDTLETVKRCAPSGSPVLIEGETGTGKELLARAIHDLSPRSGGPFVPFNCGTSTPEVFDAEICGHVRGAFTGAHGARVGLARAAHGGTLFLDEIAELNPSIQPRLLRLLDIGEVRPVGSDEVLQADVRIVAATHQDMDSAVHAKLFRSDLFYRLCTFRIRVPSLRERLDDLPILVDYFVEEARRNGYPGFAGVSTTVIGRMAKYDWPGNLRELRNEVIRLAQRSNPGERARHWHSPDRGNSSRLGDAGGTELWERDKLLDELRLTHGSVATVARKLGISRARVYRLLKHWDINLDSYRE